MKGKLSKQSESWSFNLVTEIHCMVRCDRHERQAEPVADRGGVEGTSVKANALGSFDIKRVSLIGCYSRRVAIGEELRRDKVKPNTFCFRVSTETTLIYGRHVKVNKIHIHRRQM